MVRRLCVVALLVPLAVSAEERAAKPTTGVALSIAVAEKLQTPVTLDGNDVPLRLFLDNVTAKLGVTFTVNREAFKNGPKQIASIDEQVVNVPKVADAPFVSVLRTVLAPLNGGWIIHGNIVDITTQEQIVGDCFTVSQAVGDASSSPTVTADVGTRILPLVSASFEKVALASAMKKLADQSGCNVIVKPGVANDATVTAEFANVPLDTAVEILADQCNLRFVRYNQTLYVVDEDTRDRILRERKIKLNGEEVAKPVAKAEPAARARVHAVLEGETLNEALLRLGKDAGAKVVVRPNVDGLGLRPHVDLGERPFGEAATILADMAGLSAVEFGDVVYITTADAGRKLRAEKAGK